MVADECLAQSEKKSVYCCTRCFDFVQSHIPGLKVGELAQIKEKDAQLGEEVNQAMSVAEKRPNFEGEPVLTSIGLESVEIALEENYHVRTQQQVIDTFKKSARRLKLRSFTLPTRTGPQQFSPPGAQDRSSGR